MLLLFLPNTQTGAIVHQLIKLLMVEVRESSERERERERSYQDILAAAAVAASSSFRFDGHYLIALIIIYNN